MIRLQNATLGHGSTPVLHNISLRIRPGEMVGLLGPNGSGKTTMLLTLSGVLSPISGTVSLLDADSAHGNDGATRHSDINDRSASDITSLSPKERAMRVASVPQRPDTVPDMAVRSVVLMGRYPYVSFFGGYSADDRNAATIAMQQTTTDRLANTPASQVSGGEFQRVLIARALAQSTPCMLLDEATSGLDIARKVEIYDLLYQMHRKSLTVVAAIHDLNLAALYCNRLIMLKNGTIELDGPTSEVFTEKNLCRVYETTVHVYRHPIHDVPQALFMPSHLNGQKR